MKKHNIYPVCFTAVLTLFTAYIALDTFVISDRQQMNTTSMNTSMFENTEAQTVITPQTDVTKTEKNSSDDEWFRAFGGNNTYKTETVTENNPDTQQISADSDENSYSDENISISLSEYYEYNTKIYVADIKVTSAQYIKTAFAENTFGRNVTDKTSAIASENNAVFAVNGDFYGAQEYGFVIRNGIVYRESSDSENLLCLYADGTMKIVNSDEKSADELVSEGVWQAWNFGPALIDESSVEISQNDEVGKAMASNPRTAVGMIEPCHYLFVVSDGRTTESEGLSLYQLAEFMLKFGVKTAYNLDGGGSSSMYFKGEVVNNPTTNGKSIKERGVSDIVYLG